jgi:hypothetical protein
MSNYGLKLGLIVNEMTKTWIFKHLVEVSHALFQGNPWKACKWCMEKPIYDLI